MSTWRETINQLAATRREDEARRLAAEAEEAKQQREEAIEDAFDTLIGFEITPEAYRERYENVIGAPRAGY